MFVYNEGKSDYSEDQVIAGLVDNTFRLHKSLIEGRHCTLLHVEQLGNRFSGYANVFEVSRKPDGSPCNVSNNRSLPDKGTICAERTGEQYYMNETGRLVPAGIMLHVNKRTEEHSQFNRTPVPGV